MASVSYDPNAFLKGLEASRALDAAIARNRAADPVAAGDYNAGAKQYDQLGLFNEAQALRQQPLETQKMQLGIQGQQQDLQQGQLGMDQTRQTMDFAARDQKLQEDKYRGEQALQLLGQAKRLRDEGGDLRTGLMALKPAYLQAGGDENGWMQLYSSVVSDPSALDAMENDVKTRYLNVTGGVFDTREGTFKQNPYAPDPRAQIVTRQNADGSYSSYRFDADTGGLVPLAVQAPGMGGAPAGGSLAQSAQQVDAYLSSIGARITGKDRTPQRNAEVGGAPNSMHLTGQARDIQPPPGVDRKAYVNQLKASGLFSEVIDEGDHIHLGWRPEGGQAQGVYSFGGKPASASQTGTGKLRQTPVQALQGYQTNLSQRSAVKEALEAVKRNPAAFGPQNFFGAYAQQFLDPKGVEARAFVANLGSLVIHDRSGAAVTAAEFPRLAPFIPAAEDPPSAVRTKLERFYREYDRLVKEAENFYTKENGFTPIKGGSDTAPASSGRPPLGSFVK